MKPASSVSGKLLTGLTGLALVAFLAVHLQGKLFLYAGPEALNRYVHFEESCGAHFRIEHEDADGEAERNDRMFAHAATWKYEDAEGAFESASGIGCGASVAACPSASASLFTEAKFAQFTDLPQGQIERDRWGVRMVRQMDDDGFGDFSNHAER
ncbi:MAG: hypothetical protein AAF492_01175, partial [Verrucomicrobiota bacterium]